MDSENDNADTMHWMSTHGLDVSGPKIPQAMPLRFRDVESPPPHVNALDDSVTLSDLSNSPSPSSGRRASLLSDASTNAPGPLTPTKRLFEDVVVDNAPFRYQRIHPTPHPKPRLPVQVTPRPQARVVSLPEWSRNRNPFLESLRKPRFVSSPARLKPVPLSPIYHEVDEDAESSAEVPSNSSGSFVSPTRFAALSAPDEQLPAASRSIRPGSSHVSQEHLYTVPRGLFFTPPSSQSLVLSPPTTSPERLVPTDRLPAPTSEKDGFVLGHDSEDEVSLMLHQMSIDAPSQPTRSITASTASRVSSPESVVFLSAMTQIPREFLGTRNPLSNPKGNLRPSVTSISIPEADPNNEPDDTARRLLPTSSGSASSGQDGTASYMHRASHASLPYVEHAQPVDPHEVGTAPARGEAGDWIMFEEHPQPIPALHGPASLPYARCPSGAEGVVLDSSTVDRLVWGLSEIDSQQVPDATALPELQKTRSAISTREMSDTAYESATIPRERLKKGAQAVVGSQADVSSSRPVANIAAEPSDSNSTGLVTHQHPKGKHVRFSHTRIDKPTNQVATEDEPISGSRVVQNDQRNSALHASKPKIADLALVLREQLDLASVSEPQITEQNKIPMRQETLMDQLRRFGVPFRPRPSLESAATGAHPTTHFRHIDRSYPPEDLVPSGKPSRPIHRPLPTAEESRVAQPQHRSIRMNNLATLSSVQARSLDPQPTSKAIESLANVKSIPLLKLRERRSVEAQSWRAKTRTVHEDTDAYSRGLFSNESSDFRPKLPELRPSGEVNQPSSSTQASSVHENIPATGTHRQTMPTDTRGSTPNRRRPRKAGKQRGHRSPQKESQSAEELSAAHRKPAPRHPGRKTSNNLRNKTS